MFRFGRALIRFLPMPLLIAVLLCGGLSACSDSDPLVEVREMQAAGRLRESLDPLRELLTKMPESSEVHYRYGMALARTGSPGMAVWSLRQAQRDPEWRIRAALELAQASVAAHSWANALDASNQVLELDPDNLAALQIRAEAHLGQLAHPELALEDLEHAIDLAPDDVGLKISRARALLMDGQIEEATEAMATLEETHRDLSSENATLLGPLCVLRAVFEKEKGESEKAEEELEVCLERYSADATVIHSAIDFYDEQNKFERSNELLSAALERVPQSLRYRATLASRYRQMDRVEEAEALLRAGLEFKNPELVTSIWTELTKHYAESGDISAAADAYGMAIELAPGVSEVGWLTYADMLASAERNEEALDVADKLETDFYKKLVQAHVLLNQEDPRGALELLDEVLPMWPDNPGARYFAARASEQLGDFERAIAEYRQSIRSDGAATDAGVRMARLLLAMGDDASAWTAGTHHLKAQPTDRIGQILMMRMAARGGPSPRLQNQLNAALSSRHWPELVAVYADSVAARAGPAAAVGQLRESSRLDFSNPRAAPALRSLVRYLAALEKGESTQVELSAAIAANPDNAAILALAGFEKELRVGEAAAGRAEYERAFSLDPDEQLALHGLGRIAEANGDFKGALSYFDRAAELEPERLSIRLHSARLLEQSSASSAQIEERWLALFRDFPWDASTLLSLSRISSDRSEPETALDYAQRATRTGGGAKAWDRVAEIQDELGNAELAGQAREAAALARAPQKSE